MAPHERVLRTSTSSVPWSRSLASRGIVESTNEVGARIVSPGRDCNRHVRPATGPTAWTRACCGATLLAHHTSGAVMHTLVRRYIKTAVAFLAAGLAIGGWLIVRRDLGGLAPTEYEVSAHTHAIFVGFVMMMILDRKSTRLNSSHPSISYAVFCLKKKKN